MIVTIYEKWVSTDYIYTVSGQYEDVENEYFNEIELSGRWKVIQDGNDQKLYLEKKIVGKKKKKTNAIKELILTTKQCRFLWWKWEEQGSYYETIEPAKEIEEEVVTFDWIAEDNIKIKIEHPIQECHEIHS
jgi:hypothetical protein